MFERAQQVLKSRTIEQSDEELLEKLRKLLSARGRLTTRLIDRAPGVPGVTTYKHRFGGLLEAYKLIGYTGYSTTYVNSRCRHALLRQQLLTRIIELFPDQMSIRRRGGRRWRAQLQIADGPVVSVTLAQALRRHNAEGWRVRTSGRERRHITLLARLTKDNEALEDFWVFPDLQGRGRKQFHLRRDREMPPDAKPLSDLTDLLETVAEIGRRKSIA